MSLFTPRQYDIYEDLILQLYECRNLYELQLVLLKYLQLLVPFDSAVLLMLAEDGLTVLSGLVWNLDPALFSAYRDYYQKYDLYKQAVHLLAAPPPVSRASDYLEYTSWERNVHRADFLLPQGIYHIACLEVIEKNRVHASLSLHREARRENFSGSEMQILRVLAPTIKAVYRLLSSYPTSSLEASPLIHKLTARERQVLPLLTTTLSNEAIARILGMSVNTLKSHIHHILNKTGCSSRFELTVKYGRPAPPAGEQKGFTDGLE